MGGKGRDNRQCCQQRPHLDHRGVIGGHISVGSTGLSRVGTSLPDDEQHLLTSARHPRRRPATGSLE